MRQRLVAATLDCLFEVGYERTTTVRIVERAGVSRGALLHHFESKEDIVAAAVEQLLVDNTEDIRRLAKRVSTGDMSLGDFLRNLWGRFSGRLFYITLEHVSESRHNDVLRSKLVPVTRKFHAALDDIWREFFSEAQLSDGQVETVLNMTLCLLRGMGFQTILKRDEKYYESILKTWEAILDAIVENHRVNDIDFEGIVAAI